MFRWLTRIAKFLLGFIFLVALGLTGLNYLGVYLDEERIEDIDLLPLTKVPSVLNAFDDIEAALDEYQGSVWLSLSELRGESWDADKANQLVLEHAQLLDKVSLALEKKQFMTHPIGVEFDFPAYARYLGIVDLLIVRSRLTAKQGDYSASLADLSLAVRFAQAVKTDESGILISYLIGIVMENRTLNWLHRFVSNYELSLDHLTRAGELMELIPNYQNDQFELVLSGEFAYMQTYSSAAANPPFLERFGYLFDGTLSMRNAFTEHSDWMTLLSIPSHHFFFQEHRTFNQTYRRLKHLQPQLSQSFCTDITYYHKGKQDAHALSAIGMNVLGEQSDDYWVQYMQRRCLANFYIQAIKTMVAIKRYSVESATELERLEQPVPKYLNELPKDPFTGDVILFNDQAQTIYSRGLNAVDDGGAQKNYYLGCWRTQACANNPTISMNIDLDDISATAQYEKNVSQ